MRELLIDWYTCLLPLVCGVGQPYDGQESNNLVRSAAEVKGSIVLPPYGAWYLSG